MHTKGESTSTGAGFHNKATAERQAQEPLEEATLFAQAGREFTAAPSPPHPLGLLGPTDTHSPTSRASARRETPESPTAVPASPHPLLVPLHFPPGLATHHPHFSSLPVASLRSSVITWRSTAPPLHRTYVTSPSRPGGKRKAEREIHKNLTLNWLWYLILLIYLKYHLVIPDTEPSTRPHFSRPKTPKKEKMTQTTKSSTHRQWGRKLRCNCRLRRQQSTTGIVVLPDKRQRERAGGPRETWLFLRVFKITLIYNYFSAVGRKVDLSVVTFPWKS